MTSKELFDELCGKLLPIITEDEDIIEVIEKNDFDEDQKSNFIIWLINATVYVMTGDATDPAAVELNKNCQHDMNLAVQKLQESGFDETVEKVLGEILEENIGEWLEIVQKQYAKVEPKSKGRAKKAPGVSKKDESNPVMPVFKLYTAFLHQVVAREEDVDEFLDKYDGVDREALLTYVSLNIFYSYLHEIKRGRIKPPKESQLVKHLDGLIQISTDVLEGIAKDYISGNIPDADQFLADIKEIVEDHLQEFVKKMIKKIFAAASEVKNKRE